MRVRKDMRTQKATVQARETDDTASVRGSCYVCMGFASFCLLLCELLDIISTSECAYAPRIGASRVLVTVHRGAELPNIRKQSVRLREKD